METKPKVPFCPGCGDRVVFTVPNESFLNLVLLNGYTDALYLTRYVEISEPFVLTIIGDEGEKNVFGEPGDAIVYDLQTNEWSVGWKA